MDEKEKELEGFSLEDILAEFHSDDPAEPEEDVLIWGEEAPQAAEKSVPLPQDTVRLDDITRAVRELEAAPDETVRFTPVGGEEEEEEPPVIIQPEERAEPYSDEWEPEYDDPISDYIPPEPIVFRPKSRLHELKKKLVEGPEKRYYELVEQGLLKVQLAIFANLLVAFLSIGSTVMYALEFIGKDDLRFWIFGQFLALLLSALLGSYQLMEGFGDIVKLRFSPNSLLIFSLLACLIDGVLCLQQLRFPCCAVFSLHMTMSLWGSYHKRSTEMGQMDTMRKAIRLDSVVLTPDCHEGRAGFLRGEGQVEDFMDTYNVPGGPEKVLRVYSAVALVVSLGIGVTASVLHSFVLGIQTFAVSLLMAVPAGTYITLSRPMAILERRLHKLGTVLCGWQGVKGLNADAVFPLTDEDLFPGGSVKMNGLKFYGTRMPDEVVAYATALINGCGGAMAPLFTRLLDSRNGYHYEATNLRSYNGGVGGVVNGEAVLAGNLSFIQEMGVDMPGGARVSQAVYVAIDGELSGIFAVSYNKVKGSANGLTTLCAYRKLTPVLTASDFMLTEGFLRSKFGVSTRKIDFPDQELRRALAEKEPEEDAVALALTTRDGLAGAAYAVTGARALRSACRTGVTVHMIAGILGMVMMLVLAVLGATELLTPGNVLLYEAFWLIPSLLITEWTRSV